MNDRRLTITDRNWVISTWRIEGFSDDEFDFSDSKDSTTGYVCTLLVHRPTAYRFLFGFISRSFGPSEPFHSEWTPPSANGATTHSATDRPRQLAKARDWLHRIRQETQAEDLWADIVAARAVFASSITDDNTPFTESEIRLLSEGLTATENELVKVLDVPSAQQPALHGRFEYLRSRLRTLGRLDYRNLFAGLFLNILWEFAKDHNLRQAALQVVQRNLQYLIGVGTRLLSGS